MEIKNNQLTIKVMKLIRRPLNVLSLNLLKNI